MSSKQEERDAQRGYSVPDTRDVPKRWADGPNQGKLVSKTGVKVRSLKLDPVEAEARAEASRLARIGGLGKLEIEADQAQKVANLKLAAYEVARSYHDNPWTRQHLVPPSRWPTIALVTVLTLLIAMQFAMFWKSQRPTLPPAQPSTDPVASVVPPEAQQGRVATREVKPLSKRSQTTTGAK